MSKAINLFDSETDLDRRLFIKGVGSLSLGLIAGICLGGCQSIIDQIANRPVRRRLRTGSVDVDNDIAIYTDGVAQMKALPATDPRSWDAQAGIHGTVAGGFNFCQHGTDHFFSWHRAYLYFFERIIRELTGESQWGLPYWNWNQDPAMHPAFTTAGSTLDHPRNLTDLTGFSQFQDATLDPIMADPNFFIFSDLIEGTPHDMAHVFIGQDMVTGGSPLDPIFWMHHNMVDYCWSKWNVELGNSSPGDSAWQNTTWTHFFDENGDPAEMSALGTALMPLLSFRFEESPIASFASVDFDFPGDNPDVRLASIGVLGLQPVEPPRPAGNVQAEMRVLEERIRSGANIREEVLQRLEIARGAQLVLARPLSLRTEVQASQLSESLLASRRGERTFLRIKHAHLPETNDFFIRVFLNLPSANAGTSEKNPHYAGSYAFFGTREDHRGEHEGTHGKTDFILNISNAIGTLSREGLLRSNEPLTVQLVAVPAPRQRFAKPDSRLEIESVDISLSRAIVEAID